MADTMLDRAPLLVGAVTLVIGGALAVAPRLRAAAMRLGDDDGVARAIGIADLALVPGLVRARTRWPWMLARAALNLVISEVYRAEATRPSGDPGARVGRYAMYALTVLDTGTALAIRRGTGR